MKQKYMLVIGALTICGSLLVAVPSSFAVKSMDDKELDRTTAAGQPRVDVGNGQQTITDDSLYSVSVSLDGQNAITGDSVVNVAGENNVAVGVNVANVDGGGEVDQINDIQQTRNAQVTIATLASERLMGLPQATSLWVTSPPRLITSRSARATRRKRITAPTRWRSPTQPSRTRLCLVW